MNNLVFVGSEATGYYGGAYDCFGVFVTKEYFDKYEDELRQAFSYRSHGELDGKHSDVEGELVIVECENTSDILNLMRDKQPDYAAYLYSEYVDEEELDIDLLNHIETVCKKVSEEVHKFNPYKFMLTDFEAVAVSEFINDLRRGLISCRY